MTSSAAVTPSSQQQLDHNQQQQQIQNQMMLMQQANSNARNNHASMSSFDSLPPTHLSTQRMATHHNHMNSLEKFSGTVQSHDSLSSSPQPAHHQQQSYNSMMQQ